MQEKALAREKEQADATITDAQGEMGKGMDDYFIVIGIVETGALFVLVFSLLLE